MRKNTPSVLLAVFVVGISVLGLAGCPDGVIPDFTGPFVSETSPAPRTTGVDLESFIAITFSEAIDVTTLSSSSLTVDHNGAAVPGSLTYDDESITAIFTPDLPLASGTTYSATLSSAVADMSGNLLGSDYHWYFTTADEVTPAISMVYPANGAVSVERRPQITVVFDEAMDPSTFTQASFIIQDESGPVTGTIATGLPSNVWVLTPDSDLGLRAMCTATVSVAATDVSGNPIETHHTWSFTIRDGQWSESEEIDSAYPHATSARVGLDSAGNGVAVWRETDLSTSRIYASTFIDGQWTGGEIIDSGGDHAEQPELAVNDSGDAVAVWTELGGTDWDVYANRYVNGIWQGATLLESFANDSGSVQVAIDSAGDAVAIWIHYSPPHQNLYGNRCVDGVWQGAEVLELMDNASEAPRIALNGFGNGFVAWSQLGNIYANRLQDDSWQGAVEIDTFSIAAYRPDISLNANGDGFAVWCQTDGFMGGIITRRYTEGAGWQTPEIIAGTEEGPGYPQVAVDAIGDAVFVWTQETMAPFGYHYQAFASHCDSGSFGSVVVLSSGYAQQGTPDVAVSSPGEFIATWSEALDGMPRVLVNRRIAGNWSGRAIIDDLASGGYSSAVAIDGGGQAIVLWSAQSAVGSDLRCSKFD